MKRPIETLLATALKTAVAVLERTPVGADDSRRRDAADHYSRADRLLNAPGRLAEAERFIENAKSKRRSPLVARLQKNAADAERTNALLAKEQGSAIAAANAATKKAISTMLSDLDIDAGVLTITDVMEHAAGDISLDPLHGQKVLALKRVLDGLADQRSQIEAELAAVDAEIKAAEQDAEGQKAYALELEFAEQLAVCVKALVAYRGAFQRAFESSPICPDLEELAQQEERDEIERQFGKSNPDNVPHRSVIGFLSRG